MEGVMMKNKDIYAVAVRKPDNEIAVETKSHKDFSDKVKLFKLPIFRGMLAFVDSLVIGMKVLNYSASFFDDEEDTRAPKKTKETVGPEEDFIVEEVETSHPSSHVKPETAGSRSKKEDKSNVLLMAAAVLLSIVLSVALFMVLPVILTNFFSRFISSRYLILFLEGVVRLGIFIGYVFLASRMKEIKRVFMYHGAEHKTINCLENGLELTVENVRWQTKRHKRCGTSFMLLVILISLIFFLFVPISNLIWKIVSRILMVPFIAGVSYEFIRLAGKSDSKAVHILSQPGLWMQALTTKEPDDSMIEVAIQSVSAVYDWRAFLESSASGKKKSGKKAASVRHAAGQGSSQEKSGKVSTAKTDSVNQKELRRGNAEKNSTKQSNGKQNGVKQSSEKQNNEKQNNEKQSNVKQNSIKQNSIKQNDMQRIDEKPGSIKQSGVKQGNAGQKDAKAESIRSNTAQESLFDVKPQAGGLAYTGKVKEDSSAAPQGSRSISNRNKGIAPVTLKPDISRLEDEDDDILKALDRFFDDKKEA